MPECFFSLLPARCIIMPGASSDEFFRHISRLLRHGEPDMAALDRLGEQFDTLFVGPPLGH
jgi:hypothetical protein